MCEPSHSIVQFRTGRLNELETPVSAQSNRLFIGMGGTDKNVWGKEVDRWTLLSRLGCGHHSAIRNTLEGTFMLPEHALYETNWWERKTKRDGFGGAFGLPNVTMSTHELPPDDLRTDEALAAADAYAQQVSIGSLRAFRGFFTHSIRKSERPHEYIVRMTNQMLNREGRDHFRERSMHAFATNGTAVDLGKLMTTPVRTKQVTDFMLGYTRPSKRRLLVPEWSDANELWENQKEPQAMSI